MIPPQQTIETFCLRPHYGLLELSPTPLFPVAMPLLPVSMLHPTFHWPGEAVLASKMKEEIAKITIQY